MLHINYTDRDLFQHAAEVMGDRMSGTGDYTYEDDVAASKLDAIGKGGTALVVTGAEFDFDTFQQVFHQVVDAETRNWVHGASQRLINRAAAALGLNDAYGFEPLGDLSPCGPGIGCLTAGTWLVGKPVMRCQHCGRLYPA